MVAPVKGFRDIEGKEAERRIVIREIIENIFRNYNYLPVETPVIEAEEFVRGENANDEAVSDVFKLQDRGERKLALRYEFTFQLKRLAMLKKLPYKRYEIGYVFRDEPTGGNRWKQFTQCDVDIVGSSVKEEAEVLAIANEIFDKLGIKVTINVNNRKLLNEILEKAGVKNEDRANVIREIDKLDKLSEKEVRENLKKYGAEKVLEIVSKREKDFEKYENYKLIKELKEECKMLGIEIVFVPFLARGLSYYNGSIYEIKKTPGFLDDPKSKGFMDIKTSEMKETVSAGGSYMVNGVQATGISFGLDRLEMLAKLKEENNKVMIISIGQDKKALEIASKLRGKNVPCTIMYGKISKALEYANSYGIKKVIFVGEEEIKKKKFKIRDMSSGEESFVNEKEL
jgi:histidyl-tRNA synthetase